MHAWEAGGLKGSDTMLFSSFVFLFLFLPIVLVFNYIILKKSRILQNLFLFLASLFFYAWGEPWFVLVMFISIMANWFFGILISKYKNQKRKAKITLIISLIFNIGILFIFKYLTFTLQNIKYLFGSDFIVPVILLPLGISFFTFHALSYVIDIYRGKTPAQKNPLYVGLYIFFFSQLVAGPIVRYVTIADQIQHRKETLQDFSEGACRFIIGLGKKVLLANTMSIIADKAFTLPSNELSISFAWLGAIAYTFQIFFDFSGYSDMAIGLGKMFGFHFLENFNYPYISKSISEFWRRWHISLGTWFRDYVYFPLGGSRVKTKSRLVVNLLIVWALTGVWHGANWTFIIWGLMYFALITFEKLTDFEEAVKSSIIKHLYTLFFVIIGWVIFRSADMGQAITYLKTMLFANGWCLVDKYAIQYLSDYKILLLFAVVFSTPVAKVLPNKIKNNKVLHILYPIIYISIFLVSISYIVKGSYNPFIYFNF